MDDTPEDHAAIPPLLSQIVLAVLSAAATVIGTATTLVLAQAAKPNIILILSDDSGYGDLGPYGGGEGRGMPTPNIDRLADEGMTFFSFYAQPSCTPGRAAMQTGRIPNRSGMTTVAFQGQGGGLPAAEWTLASVLKTGGYQTFFTGKWHLGEADYALPNAQGYDEMKYVGLYHLNAYTYADPTWFPDMPPELRAMFEKVTKGALSGKAGRAGASKSSRSTASTSTRPAQGVVGIPFFDELRREGGAGLPRRGGQGRRAVLHQRQLHEGAPAEHAAPRLHPQVDVEEQVCRLGRRARHAHRPHHGQAARTRPGQEHLRLLHHRQRRLAGRLSRRRLHAVPRHQGHRARGRQPRPGDRLGPGKIKAGSKNHDIVGGLDLMATFASLAGVKLPDKDREGKPIIFDSYDMTPVLFGTGKSARKAWFYFTENELSPGAVRGATTSPCSTCAATTAPRPAAWPSTPTSAGRGPEYVATVPQVFDLWQDPQERYDIFMNNFTERTWMGVVMEQELKKLMKTYVQYPPRKLQSYGYTGPITLSNYERFQWVREQLRRKASTFRCRPATKGIRMRRMAMSRKRSGRFGHVCSILVVLVSALAVTGALQASLALAADEEESATELAKKTQNPVADLISVPFQNNFFFNSGSKDATVYVLDVEPVIPINLTKDWNLITRTIIPIINQPPLFPEPSKFSDTRSVWGTSTPRCSSRRGSRRSSSGALDQPSRFRPPPIASWATGSSPWDPPAWWS